MRALHLHTHNIQSTCMLCYYKSPNKYLPTECINVDIRNLQLVVVRMLIALLNFNVKKENEIWLIDVMRINQNKFTHVASTTQAYGVLNV